MSEVEYNIQMQYDLHLSLYKVQNLAYEPSIVVVPHFAKPFNFVISLEQGSLEIKNQIHVIDSNSLPAIAKSNIGPSASMFGLS